jgi:hypothetical protein
MLPNFSQYSPQGLLPQFPGPQGAGSLQINPALFGQPGCAQPGANGGNAAFGFDFAQTGPSPQSPFGPQANSFQHNPFQGSVAGHAGHAGLHNPSQHVIMLLGQLAQQLSAHSVLTQYSASALQQLAQVLAAPSQQNPWGGPGIAGQYFGQSPFANAQGAYGQGAYAGFGPQAQAWGANRSQTIQ